MPDIWGMGAILSKLMLYVGIGGATGLLIIRAAFADLVSPLRDKMRVQVALLAGLALAGSVLGFMLRGAALTGEADGMTDPEMLGLLWQTPVGDVLIYRITGAVLIICGVFIPLSGNGSHSRVDCSLCGPLLRLGMFLNWSQLVFAFYWPCTS